MAHGDCLIVWILVASMAQPLPNTIRQLRFDVPAAQPPRGVSQSLP